MPCIFPPNPTARDSPPSHASGANFRRRTRMLKRVRTNIRSSGGRRWIKNIMDWWTRGVWSDVATRGVQRHLGKAGVRLKVQRAW